MMRLNMHVPLTKEQTIAAVKDLSVKTELKSYPRVDGPLCDPPLRMQNVGLFSFIPASGATPNEHGIYGFAKIRGVFASDIESDQYAVELIRNCDSMNQILHVKVGVPFRIATNSKYSEEVKKVDPAMKADLTEEMKRGRQAEKRKVRELQKKEEALRDDVDKTDREPLDVYIELRTKRANLLWALEQHEMKMKELPPLIDKAQIEIEKMDKEDSSYQEKFYAQYMNARKQAGIKDDSKTMTDTFMKFMT